MAFLLLVAGIVAAIVLSFFLRKTGTAGKAAVIPDSLFDRLSMFRNVLVTGHQAFFTKEALTAIAETTIENISTVEVTGTTTVERRELVPN